jgi:hypothetical protein
VIVHNDNVVDVFDAAVAHHLGATADEVVRIDVVHADLVGLARQRHGADLEKTEFRRLPAVLRQPHGEFDLHRPADRISGGGHERVENRSQRKQAMLEDGREAHEARTLARETVIDRVVVGRIG